MPAVVRTTTGNNAPPHVLIVPFPSQGHMIPLLDLTHKLASDAGFTITILTTPKNLSLLHPLLSSHPSIHTLLLPLPSHPALPSGVENTKDSPHPVRPLILSLSNLINPILHWFRSHPDPPHFIISDMFCGWTHRLASQLGIRRLVFSPSGAFALSTMYYLWRENPKRKNEEDENEVVCYHKLPNSPTYPWWQVSPLYRSYIEGDAESANLKDAFLCNIESWGLIVNTFTSLEKVHLDFLRKYVGHDHVWDVGPLLPPDNTVTQRGGSSSVSPDDVVSWLDRHKDREVVYICFGSQALLSEDQTDEIASALDKSGVHFIWSVRDGNGGVIPSGFEDRTGGRGLVIRGWAPQVVILKHRAVGVFLSHCGWNSVMEAVAVGVPMLAWPMSADQFANATLLVEELKVARRVCEGANSIPNSDDLARVLAESVSERGTVERAKALKLQAKALDAIGGGEGSSVKNFGCLIDRLSASSLD